MSGAGKSSLAQQLASRLNMPNVLQTDALYEVSYNQPRPLGSHSVGPMFPYSQP